MDDRPRRTRHPTATMPFQRAHERLNERGGRARPPRRTRPAAPRTVISAGTVAAAVFAFGGALRLDRPLPPRGAPSDRGAGFGFPWVTLMVNLSGSLAIGTVPVPSSAHCATGRDTVLLRPLVLVGFLGGWTTYSTLAVEATLLAKNGDLASCLAYLVATLSPAGWPLVVVGRTPQGGRWYSVMSAPSPTLGLALCCRLPRPAASGRYLACPPDPSHRAAASRPTASRHADRQRLRVARPRAPHRDGALSRPGRSVRGRDRSRAVRRVHHVVDRQLGNGAPRAHGSPNRSRRLHPGRPRGLPQLRGGRHRIHGPGLAVRLGGHPAPERVAFVLDEGSCPDPCWRRDGTRTSSEFTAPASSCSRRIARRSTPWRRKRAR